MTESAPTATAPSGAAVIPDFVEDARTVASFSSARERFDNAETQAAEDEIRIDFKKRRDIIQAEVASADLLLAERQSKFDKALEAYKKKYPKQIERNRPRKPSFMQNLTSFGAAGRLFNSTMSASGDLNDAKSLRRRKENEDEELEGQQRRAILKAGEAMREKSQTKEHYEKFLSRPGNKELAKKVDAIKNERTSYAERLEADKVPPVEQRDRQFAEWQATKLEAPCTGVAIVGVEAYGNMCYLIFRDREKKHFFHPYDARLEGLSDTVFDVYRIADRFEAKVHRREGKPMNLSDHLTEYLRDEEAARSAARRIRALLRETRPAQTEPGDPALMELLAELAKTATRFNQ
jgi:hypothetical protein